MARGGGLKSAAVRRKIRVFMGPLFKKAVDDAGLGPLVDALHKGDALRSDQLALLERADITLLGALADVLREQRVGRQVDLVASTVPVMAVGITRVNDHSGSGLDVLRAVALARIAHPDAKLAVSVKQTGAELAQVALAYGANMLCDIDLSERALPIADKYKPDLKRDLTLQLERAGREVRWHHHEAMHAEYAEK